MSTDDALVLARRVRARRRLVVRLGFGGLFLVSAAACFDQSTYQGGGRRDIGGQLSDVDAGEGDEDTEPVPTTEPTATSKPDSGSVVPVQDAGAEAG